MASNAYCSINEFNRIVEQMRENPTLFNTICEFYNLHLNLAEEDLIELIGNNPIVFQLVKRENATVIADQAAFEELKNGEYVLFLNDFLILPEEQDTVAIRNEYGILAVHANGEFFTENSYNFGYTIEDSDSCKFKSWKDVFGQKPITPLNSAILIDNYLWSNLDEFSRENEENLFPIIDHLIPKTLKTPFHLIFIIENGRGRFNPKNAEEKLKKVLKYASKQSDTEVRGAIVAQTDTKIFHERVLITNHHYFYSDKGVAVFKEGRLRNPTKGDRNFVFKDINNFVGETRKHQQLSIIRNIKKAIDDNKKATKNSVIFNIGDINSPLLN